MIREFRIIALFDGFQPLRSFVAVIYLRFKLPQSLHSLWDLGHRTVPIIPIDIFFILDYLLFPFCIILGYSLARRHRLSSSRSVNDNCSLEGLHLLITRLLIMKLWARCFVGRIRTCDVILQSFNIRFIWIIDLFEQNVVYHLFQRANDVKPCTVLKLVLRAFILWHINLIVILRKPWFLFLAIRIQL